MKDSRLCTSCLFESRLIWRCVYKPTSVWGSKDWIIREMISSMSNIHQNDCLSGWVIGAIQCTKLLMYWSNPECNVNSIPPRSPRSNCCNVGQWQTGSPKWLTSSQKWLLDTINCRLGKHEEALWWEQSMQRSESLRWHQLDINLINRKLTNGAQEGN